MTIIRNFLNSQTFSEIEEIKDHLESGVSRLTLSGLEGASKYFIAQLVSEYLDRPYLLISDYAGYGTFADENTNFFSSEKTGVFRKKEYSIKSLVGNSNFNSTCERISSLSSLPLNKNLIAESPAIFEKILPRKLLKKNKIEISTDIALDRAEFIESLQSIGLRKSEIVEHTGQFSLRGAVVDVFSPGNKYPIRTEFIGDRVRSLRFFDPKNQKSINRTDRAVIWPATEFIYGKDPEEISGVIYSHAVESEVPPGQRNSFMEIVEKGGHIDELEWLTPLIYNTRECLLDHLKKDCLIFLDLDIELETTFVKHLEEYQRLRSGTDRYIRLLPEEEENFLLYSEIEKKLAPFQLIYFNDLLSKSDKCIKFSTRTSVIKPGKNQTPVSKFADNVKKLVDDGYKVHSVSFNDNEREKLESILIDYDLENINYFTGPLRSGFILENLKVAFFTENDLYEKGKKSQHIIPEDVSSAFISSFSDLKPGDYLVHKQFGIGIYRGLNTIALKGKEGDFIECEYRGGDKIYVPVENLKLVQKYIGDGKRPIVDKLGSDTWNKTVKKVKKVIESVARELLELYAKRKTIKGYGFSKPDQGFREFELGFKYEETADQARSIEEVLADMELEKPMDRLICGDVGFGKTEVAMRAAFKAVMDGKQVAFLVPTTLLASQHFQTFRERLGNYPVMIDMLSRFRSAKETGLIVNKIRDGKLDILIGTHKLLGNKISFNNLGLVIIDEEHKFGVKHKEKLRAISEGVDVLSLSATPIPRTLQLSLAEIRDISVIKSPPEGRLPVDVYVKNYASEIIREAVIREINRGGSVFFINNRIESIFKVADELKTLIPEASIAVTHGRMKEKVLEKSMGDFISGRVNLLVTTAIVESGLDIPGANTIIVNDAHKFGLADLYQLKGRVGRGSTKAFAYFLIPSLKLLTPDAVKRLTKISELQDLGSGFKLALSDLEIRGAGNLFGEQQSGTISNVGLELYLELLQEAIQMVKGEEQAEDFDTEIINSERAYIPENYISDSSERLYFYKRISSFKTLTEIRESASELKDRFGPLPGEVKNLLRTMEFKIKCRRLRIFKLEIKDRSAAIYFSKDSPHIQNYKPSGKLSLHYDPEKKYRIINRRLNEIRRDNNN